MDSVDFQGGHTVALCIYIYIFIYTHVELTCVIQGTEGPTTKTLSDYACQSRMPICCSKLSNRRREGQEQVGCPFGVPSCQYVGQTVRNTRAIPNSEHTGSTWCCMGKLGTFSSTSPAPICAPRCTGLRPRERRVGAPKLFRQRVVSLVALPGMAGPPAEATTSVGPPGLRSALRGGAKRA